jgi:hypothetical protein
VSAVVTVDFEVDGPLIAFAFCFPLGGILLYCSPYCDIESRDVNLGGLA